VTVAGTLGDTGYTFDGWSLSPSGSVVTSFVMPGSNQTLYAQWTATAPTYSVTYNANYPATGTESGTLPSISSYLPGATVTVAGTLGDTGYTFDGWSLSPSGSVVTSFVMPGSNQTLYAQWMRNSTVKVTVIVTYPVNGSTYGTNWSAAITGTASITGRKIISSVKVAIENTTTGKWWNGTSFSATSQTFEVATGTTSWRYALPASYLVSGDAYSVIAQATDSGAHAATSSAVTFTYATSTTPVSTTTSLSISPPFVTYGFEHVETFTVTVTGTMGILPGGTVTIKLGSTTLCSTSSLSPLSHGSITATCNLTNLQLPVGGYSVTAVYSGNSHYVGSTSGPGEFRVTKDRTSINVSASPTSVIYGNESAATFTTTVRTGNGEPVPNGETVTVHVGPAICTAVLNGGTGTCTIASSALPPGTYPISTTYGGDANLKGGSSSFWTSLVVRHSSRHVARESSRRR
jgi:uncharacterized repeat protein (TIGR02543 family)